MRLNDKLRSEIKAELRAERYDLTPEGVYLPRNGINFQGEYWDRINGSPFEFAGCNLVVDEGLIHILNVSLGSTAKPAGYYLALFSGGASPQPNWTAATFASAATEIVSEEEGYVGVNRPQWNYTNASGSAQIDNFATPAEMTMATDGSLNVTGAALLSTSARGGNQGVLVSASAFPVTRVFQDGDLYELGYRINASV